MRAAEPDDLLVATAGACRPSGSTCLVPSGILGSPCRAGLAIAAADDAAVAGRRPAVRHQLALLDVGQPVLPWAQVVAAASELLARGRDGARLGLLCRLPRPPRRSREGPRDRKSTRLNSSHSQIS